MDTPSQLNNFLRSKGADIIGFANLEGVESDARDGFPFGISIAVALNPSIISEIKDGPTKQYHAEYERVNSLLDTLGRYTTHFLEERGHKGKRIDVSASYDLETLSTKLPHKITATRSGLGWIGKCALLITKAFGSAIRITTVLTDLELPTADPVDASGCGNCTVCVDACPGHAPSGKEWQIGLYRDSFFDPFACRDAAREMAAKRVGISLTLCGICIAVCPWTQKYIKGAG